MVPFRQHTSVMPPKKASPSRHAPALLVAATLAWATALAAAPAPVPATMPAPVAGKAPDFSAQAREIERLLTTAHPSLP